MYPDEAPAGARLAYSRLAVRNVDPAYATIRIDLDVPDDEARFTVRRIDWDEQVTEREVQRLQEVR